MNSFGLSFEDFSITSTGKGKRKSQSKVSSFSGKLKKPKLEEPDPDYEYPLEKSKQLSEHSPKKSQKGAKRGRKKRSPVWEFFHKNAHELSAVCSLCNTVCFHSNNTSNLYKHLRLKHPDTIKDGEFSSEFVSNFTERTYSFTEPPKKAGRPRKLKPTNLAFVMKTEEPILDEESEMIIKEIKQNPPNFCTNNNLTPNFNITQNTPLSVASKSQSKVVSKRVMNEALVSMLSTDSLPVSMVEGKGFLKFINAIDPKIALPSRQELQANLIPSAVKTVKDRIAEELKEGLHLSLSTEYWKYSETQNYVTVSAHFINDRWKMCNVLLDSFDLADDDSEVAINIGLSEITEAWKITDKVISLVCKQEEEHVVTAAVANQWEPIPCFGNLLNDVIVEAIKSIPEVRSIQQKTREAVQLFENSKKAADMLAAVVEQHNINFKTLRSDIPDRWTSTLEMLEGMVEEFQAVNTVLCFLDKSSMCLCDGEIETIKQLISLLKPFEAASTSICTDSFSHVSKVIPLSNLLQQLISSNLETTNGSCVDFQSSLQQQMETRFPKLETNFSLAIATLLDPRFKTHAFQDLGCLEDSKAKLLSEMNSLIATNPQKVVQKSEPEMETSEFWGYFDKKVQEAGAQTSDELEAENELHRYLKEPNIPRNNDPLKWWKLNDLQFPNLSVLARRYLCIPATCIPSERIFTEQRESYHQKRQALAANELHTLLFLNYN